MSEDLPVISNKEFLTELRNDVKNIQTTLIAHVSTTQNQLENIFEENKKTNGRVTVLETEFRNLSIGSATTGTKITIVTSLISFIVAAVVTAIVSKFLQ